MNAADLADGVAETLIVPSFTRIGFGLRSALDDNRKKHTIDDAIDRAFERVES